MGSARRDGSQSAKSNPAVQVAESSATTPARLPSVSPWPGVLVKRVESREESESVSVEVIRPAALVCPEPRTWQADKESYNQLRRISKHLGTNSNPSNLGTIRERPRGRAIGLRVAELESLR